MTQLLKDLVFSPFVAITPTKDIDFLLAPGNIAILQNEYINLVKQKISMVCPMDGGEDIKAYIAAQHTLDGKIEMLTTIIGWHNRSLQQSPDKQHQEVANTSVANTQSPEFAKAASLVNK